MGIQFDFERLEVWQKAVKFAVKVISLMEGIEGTRRHFRLLEQIEASSTSVASNISEGKGRRSDKEYVQFLFIARGSLFETISQLEVCRQMGWIAEGDFETTKSSAFEITKMLNALITSIRKRN